MVNYEGKGWLRVIFRLHGSVLPALLPRILGAAAIGLAARYLYSLKHFHLPNAIHALLGVALGLLLVFRTNASYDRWWEGRRLLG
ncbi:MAG: bestrophin family ion channel, partial [Deltaproteobacteria bacterium]